MNILKRRFINSGKTVHQVAKAMNVDPERVKEVINNDRPLEGANFDKFIAATEKTTLEDTITRQEMLQWYKDTNITELRASWGYKGYEVANKLGIPVSTYSHIETKRLSNPKQLDIIYDFFHDDINKNYVNGKIPYVSTNIGRSTSKNKQLSFDIPKAKTTTKKEFKEIIRFFKEDLEDILDSIDKTRDEVANELNVHKSYFSNCIHHAEEFTRITPTMKKVYDYFKTIQDQMNKDSVEEKPLDKVWEDTKAMIDKVDDLNDQIKEEGIKLGLMEDLQYKNFNTEPEETIDSTSSVLGLGAFTNTYNPDFHIHTDSYDKEVTIPSEHISSIEIKGEYPKLNKPVIDYEPSDEKKEVKKIILKQIQRIYDAPLDKVDMEVKRSELLTKLADAYKDLGEM